MKSWHHGFSLIELLVVIGIIALLIGILLPVLGIARKSARQTQNSTQVRGIHQGFFLFSQGNRGFFPGVDNIGTNNDQSFTDGATIRTLNNNTDLAAGRSVTARFCIAFEANLFTPEYAVSPAEMSDQIKLWEDITDNYLSGDHLSSYALSQLTGGQSAREGRLVEWSDTNNAQAVMMGDRLKSEHGDPSVVMTQPETFVSIWSSNGAPPWNGSVTFNDNHTEYLPEPVVENTRYGNHTNTEPDNLFAGQNDPNKGVNGGRIGTNARLAVGVGSSRGFE